MSRRYPRPIPHFRPVSQNAYDTFIRRIYAVVPMDSRCGAVVEALDKYLAGDRETYASHLDEHTAITFEMLRFEVDKAIERSARARRPRRRKVEAEMPDVMISAVKEKTVEKTEKPAEKKKRATKTKKNKNKPADVKTPEIGGSEPSPVNHTQSDLTPERKEPEPLLPRHIRRAAILAMRPRRKWKKIG